ncbi:MAG: endonuclease NucS domain-containing protein [Limisphaerales bacterium]
MPDRLENRIRDYLAEHLEILGDDLSLLHKEYQLPNPVGSAGKIDILARDKYGIFVVIEIKRSDQAARQTLNEVHKYTALLRNQHGLDETQVRVIIVSTDWNELRLPLSECVDAFPYAIEPFGITTLPDGTVNYVERIKLLPKTGIIRLSRIQWAYCYRDAKTRDTALSNLIAATASTALKDFVVLRLDYTGKSPAVCFPFTLYFLFSSPLLNATLSEAEKIKAQVEWDDSLDQPDENFFVAVMRSFVEQSDDFELGYPEKLTSILRDWKIVEFSRHGRLAPKNSLLTDADVLSLAQAVEGGSPIYIYKLCSPKLSAAWKQLQTDLVSTLRGMSEWESIVPVFLKEIESESPNASVSVYIYNPADLFMSLYPVAWTGDFSQCPRLEVVVENVTNKRVRLLASLLAWDGRPLKDTPEQIVERIYGSVIKWMSALHFHETYKRETSMMAAHCLIAPMVEFTYAENKTPSAVQLAKSGLGLSRKPFNWDGVKGLPEFSIANKNYLHELKAFVESHIFGLPGSAMMECHNSSNE